MPERESPHKLPVQIVKKLPQATKAWGKTFNYSPDSVTVNGDNPPLRSF
jgi:hypothetical protein